MILDDNLGNRIKSALFILFVVDKLVVCDMRLASDFRVSFRVKPLNRDKLQSAIQVSDNDLPRKSYFLMSITVTKDDVMRYIKNRPEYKKVNAFKDMKVDIYI